MPTNVKDSQMMEPMQKDEFLLVNNNKKRIDELTVEYRANKRSVCEFAPWF